MCCLVYSSWQRRGSGFYDICCRDMRILMWEYNMAQLLWNENSLGAPQEVKYRVATWLSHSIPRNIPQITKSVMSSQNLYIKVHSNIVSKNGKQAKCPSIDKWINKTQYIPTMVFWYNDTEVACLNKATQPLTRFPHAQALPESTPSVNHLPKNSLLMLS